MESITSTAGPEAFWELRSDVATWAQWDPTVESVALAALVRLAETRPWPTSA